MFDKYTKLLLHCNGADGSTSFPDSSNSNHTVTAYGNAQVDTAQYKFGNGSLLCDGTGDILTIPNHTDFDFGSGEFTIDFWVRFNSLANYQSLISKRATNTDFCPYQILVTSTDMWFYASVNGTMWDISLKWTYGASLTTNIWYHIAVVRNGNNWNLYIDGVSKASTSKSITPMTNTVPFCIGGNQDASESLNGWMDELRVSKGIARWIGNFAPPTQPYTYPKGGVAIGSPMIY